MTACVVRQMTQTGCPWSRPRVCLSLRDLTRVSVSFYIYLSIYLSGVQQVSSSKSCIFATRGCLSVCMLQAVAASSTLCELCMLISLILAARAGLPDCARSKRAGGFDQVTTPPLRATIGLSADPANVPNQCARMQGKGSSAASAVWHRLRHRHGNKGSFLTCVLAISGNHAYVGTQTYASNPLLRFAAFTPRIGHLQECMHPTRT